MRRKILYISVCTDGAGFFNRGNQSWGPYTGVCFNLPPWLRNKFGLLFLFGVMPSKIKNYSSTCTAHVTRVHAHNTGLVAAILAGCAPYMWESAERGPGLLVWDAFTNEHVRKWFVFIRVIEDGAGLQKPLCCHKQPAKIGASPSPHHHCVTL